MARFRWGLLQYVHLAQLGGLSCQQRDDRVWLRVPIASETLVRYSQVPLWVVST